MKIIISPSKTQNTDNLKRHKEEDLANSSLALKLFSIMKSYSKSDLGSSLKIKKSLLDKTYNLYQEKDNCSYMKKAIDLYEGVAFNQIQNDDFSQKQEDYLNQHLVILSAMFGPLKPNSFICPYRLDMNNRPSGINLYHYWKEAINTYFSSEENIINLASLEFSRMLNDKSHAMINIEFLEETKSSKLKSISYNAKKARGKMVNQIILNRLTNIGDLKTIIVDDYIYNDSLSDQFNYVYVKEKK